VISTGCW